MTVCYMRCRSHNGHPKRRYTSFNHARVAAQERNWDAKVYACPWTPGVYHITHKQGGAE